MSKSVDYSWSLLIQNKTHIENALLSKNRDNDLKNKGCGHCDLTAVWRKERLTHTQSSTAT